MSDILVRLAGDYKLLLDRLGAPIPDSSFQGKLQCHPTDNGYAHVELVDGALNYVVTDRGSELQRRVAESEEQLLYWLIDDVTSDIAWRTRPSPLSMLRRQNPRQFKFETHIKLLSKLNPEWGEIKKKYYQELLEKYPYRTKT